MLERIQKVLSRAGVSSRRKAEELIAEGRVLVNGKKVTELGTRVDAAKDEIRVDGALVADIEDRVYYVLFKPAGCVTTLSDPEGRPTVRDYLKFVRERIYPVGRLDYDAEGVIILTNDGELAHKMMHPKFGATRTYLAKVKGVPNDRTVAQLREGVRLDDGMAKPLEADLVEKAEKNTWIRLVVAEGRPHLVKRLCEAVGHPVQRLFRSNYAGIGVEGMMAGEVRELTTAEVKMLKAGTQNVPAGKTAKKPSTGPSKLPPRRDARRTAFKPKSGGRGRAKSRGR